MCGLGRKDEGGVVVCVFNPGYYKVVFKIRIYYLFFISLSHLCFAGQFVFYVNLNVFRYEIR